MNQQESAHPPGDPPDATAALSAALSAAEHEMATMRAALAAAGERERLLTHELQHRVRNMLAVIRSIYRRTREIGASQDEFAEHFQGRLDAVARYYSHGEAAGAGIDLEDMLRDELLQAHGLDGSDCTIDGPPVRLCGMSAELMGLVIHELVTNSIKFGAVGQGGKLAVAWTLGQDGRGSRLDLRWSETGVSLVAPAPRPFGFGREMIEEALPYQLGATTSFDLRPGGLDCAILLPLPSPDTAADERLPVPPVTSGRGIKPAM